MNRFFLSIVLGLLVAALPMGRALADQPAANPPKTADASKPCDPYEKYECLDAYLGDGFWERLYNYYKLEWGKPGAPVDPKAPPGRRDNWPATPETTPPMPFTEWPYGGTTSLGVNRPASVDSPLMVALANTGIGKWMADGNMQFYGWVNAGGNVSTSSQHPGGNAPAAYLYTPDTVQLDQFVLYFERTPDTVQKDHIDWGFRLSAIYGENYRYTTSYGLASYQLLTRNNVNGYDFPMEWIEAFFPQVMDGLNVRFGRYISLPDIEAQLAPNNYMYTHSMTYTFDNYTNTGLQTTLAVTPQFFVQVGVTIGTEAPIWHESASITNPDPNIPGTPPGQFGYNPLYPGTTFKKDPGARPSGTVCVRWNSKTGNDDVNLCADAINTGEWGYNNLQWFGGTAYHKWNDQWHISFEAYHLYQRNVPNILNPVVQQIALSGGTPFTSPFADIKQNAPNMAQCSNTSLLKCTAGSWGTTFYLNYSPDPLDNISLRPEFFWDPQGQRTGIATRYGNLALGWQHWLSPQIELRPEIAYYHSFNATAFNANLGSGPSGAGFTGNPATGGFTQMGNRSSETILSGDIIWHF